MYLVGTGKLWDEGVLCFYYFMGISQNLLIYVLKRHYEQQACGNGGSKAAVEPLEQESVVFEMPALRRGADGGGGGGDGGSLAGGVSTSSGSTGLHDRREYGERRLWFKRRVFGSKSDHEQLEAAGYHRVNVKEGAGKDE